MRKQIFNGVKIKLASISALLAIMFLIAGCGQKTNVNQGANQPSANENNQNAPADLSDVSGSYSINQLMTMNKPMKCTWKDATADSEVTNVLYIQGKKFRQDVTMGDLGKAFTVSDGEYVYIWNDFTGAATKFKIDEISNDKSDQQAANDNSAGLEQPRNFSCAAWTVDNSVFSIPTDKTFKDATEDLKQAVEQSSITDVDKAKQQLCDLCNSAPEGEARQQCLTNAQCK